MTTDATAATTPTPQPPDATTAPTPPRRGRPRIHPLPDPTAPPRPRGRPRKDGLPAGSVPQPQPRPRPTPAPQVAPAPVTVAPALTPHDVASQVAITDKSRISEDIDDNTQDISEDNTRENTEHVGVVDVVKSEKDGGKAEKIDWGEVIAEREKSLETAILAILPAESAHVRGQLADLFARLSQGEFWTNASQAVGLAWPLLRAMTAHNVNLTSLYHAAKEAGEEWRAGKLEAVTYERATDGWIEPVFHKGIICGHVKRFSDRLAEIHLRASNPARFAPSPGEAGGGQAQTIIIHLDTPQVRPAIPTASTEIDPAATPDRNQ